MTDKLPQNTPELLSEIDREWLELQKVIKKLTEEQMTAPEPGGWAMMAAAASLLAVVQLRRRALV